MRNLDYSPPNVLFRTHQYEFILAPSKEFFEKYGRQHGYFIELKMFRKEDSSETNKFKEFTEKGIPIVKYTQTEDPLKKIWIVMLEWPEDKCTFRGEYCLKLSIFRKEDQETFKRIFSKISTTFQVVSKPQVYINQKKNQRDYSNFLPNMLDIIQSTPPMEMTQFNAPEKRKVQFFSPTILKKPKFDDEESRFKRIEKIKKEEFSFLSLSFSQDPNTEPELISPKPVSSQDGITFGTSEMSQLSSQAEVPSVTNLLNESNFQLSYDLLK